MSVHDRGSHITAGFGFVHPREVLESPPGESGLPDDSLIVLRDTFQEPVLTDLGYHRADTGQRYAFASLSNFRAIEGRLRVFALTGFRNMEFQRFPYQTARCYVEFDVYVEQLIGDDASRRPSIFFWFTYVTNFFDGAGIAGSASTLTIADAFFLIGAISVFNEETELDEAQMAVSTSFDLADAASRVALPSVVVRPEPYRFRGELTTTEQIIYLDDVEVIRRALPIPNLAVMNWLMNERYTAPGREYPFSLGNLEVGRNF